MALDGNTMRRMARLDCVDYDESGTHGTPTDPAAPDATYNREIERAYLEYAAKVEPRYQRIAASTSGLDLSGAYTALTTITNIAEIAGAQYNTASSGAVHGTPMERIKVHEAFEALAAVNYGVGAGAPYRWAAERVETDTEASQGKWRIYLDQQHDSTGAATLYVILNARLEPAAIGGTTGTPDVSELGSYIIAKIAAARMALKIGEDIEFAAAIMESVPDNVVEAMNLHQLALRPRAQAMERAS